RQRQNEPKVQKPRRERRNRYSAECKSCNQLEGNQASRDGTLGSIPPIIVGILHFVEGAQLKKENKRDQPCDQIGGPARKGTSSRCSGIIDCRGSEYREQKTGSRQREPFGLINPKPIPNGEHVLCVHLCLASFRWALAKSPAAIAPTIEISPHRQRVAATSARAAAFPAPCSPIRRKAADWLGSPVPPPTEPTSKFDSVTATKRSFPRASIRVKPTDDSATHAASWPVA